MIESTYRLRCDQCHSYGPQGVDQQQIWDVASRMNWTVDPAAGKCLCNYCRPDGYAKGVQEGREAERGRCLTLIDQLLERTRNRNDSNCTDDLIDLKNTVLLGLRVLPEEDGIGGRRAADDS